VSVVDYEMIQVFKKELELCKVREGEVFAVLSVGTLLADYAQAFMFAAQMLGAKTFHLNVRDHTVENRAGVIGKTPLAGNRPAIEALKSADMVVDLMGLLFSKEQLEIQAAGTRILRVGEAFHILKQMFPEVSQRERVERGAELMRKAKQMHITSEAGTDVRYGLQQYPVMTQYGYTDEPGRWDHFPSAFLFTQGNDDDVHGTIVLQPGDALVAFKRYIHDPVKLAISNGYITDIDGEGIDADLIRDYIESFEDPRAYAISHIGWGMHERAAWYHMLATSRLHEERYMNSLSFYGNVLFSTGPNSEFGGSNDTACHLDIPMRKCSLFLDDLEIVRKGKVIHPELKAR